MALFLAPLAWGLIVEGVGVLNISVYALHEIYKNHDFRFRRLGKPGKGLITEPDMDFKDPDLEPIGDPVTIEDIQKEIERMRRGAGVQGEPEPEPDPEKKPKRFPARPRPRTLGTQEDSDETLQQKLRRRCHEEGGKCPYCPPADDGKPYLRSFNGGTIARPYYSSIGAVYQHYVVPWFSYATHASSFSGEEKIYISIQELEWKHGKKGTWDGLDYLTCTLIETKFGYGKFVNADILRDRPREAPQKPRSGGRGDSTLEKAFGKQLKKQANTVQAERDQGHQVGLRWVFSNDLVRQVFEVMTQNAKYFFVSSRHEPMRYGVVLEEMHETDLRTSDPSADYGNWG